MDSRPGDKRRDSRNDWKEHRASQMAPKGKKTVTEPNDENNENATEAVEAAASKWVARGPKATPDELLAELHASQQLPTFEMGAAQNEDDEVDTGKPLLRQPPKAKCCRTRSAEGVPVFTFTLEGDEGDRSTEYLVLGEALKHEEFREVVRPMRAFVFLCETGRIYVWTRGLIDLDADAKTQKQSAWKWIASSYRFARMCLDGWAHYTSATGRTGYKLKNLGPDGRKEAPHRVWPDKSDAELVIEAFGANIIRSVDHPVIQGLYVGEVDEDEGED